MKRFVLLAVFLFLWIYEAQAINCPRCHLYNPDNASYCSQCGAPLYQDQQFIFCQNCGFQNPFNASFCAKCGVPLHQGVPVNQNYPPPVYQQQGQTVNLDSLFEHKHKDKKKPPQNSWRYVAQIVSTKGANADEYPGTGQIKKIRFVCLSGSPIIHTIVVREGGNVTHIPITTHFNPGQEVVKDLPRDFNSTGFRVSHEGEGKIDLYAQ